MKEMTPSPMHIAAIAGHARVVDLLVARGADVNKANDYGYTPLHFAALMRRFQVCQRLIQLGADVGAQDIYGGSLLLLHSSIFEISFDVCADRRASTDICGRSLLILHRSIFSLF
jgi:ankyrin repeat protein